MAADFVLEKIRGTPRRHELQRLGVDIERFVADLGIEAGPVDITGVHPVDLNRAFAVAIPGFMPLKRSSGVELEQALTASLIALT